MKKDFRSVVFIVGMAFVSLIAICRLQAARTDITALQGGTASAPSLRNVDVFRVDVNGGIHGATSTVTDFFSVAAGSGSIAVWTGDVSLQAGNGLGTSLGQFPGYKVRFFNGGPTTAQGSVIIASGSAVFTSFGIGSTASVLSTTSVLGVSDGAYLQNTFGYMTVSGYALCLTTGTVQIGDVIVTTNSAVGFGGRNNTPTSGTDYAVALATGQVAGGLTLCNVRY